MVAGVIISDGREGRSKRPWRSGGGTHPARFSHAWRRLRGATSRPVSQTARRGLKQKLSMERISAAVGGYRYMPFRSKRETFCSRRFDTHTEPKPTRMESPPAPAHWLATALVSGSM